jgi:hypothetical protein
MEEDSMRTKMTLLAYLALTLMLSTTLAAKKGDVTFTDPEKAAKEDPDFLVQGEYTGMMATATGTKQKVGIQVIALSNGKFDAMIHTGGLPGDGWDKKAKAKQSGDAAAIKKLVAGLKRVERVSPTMGAKPPKGAIVLFDGTKESIEKHWKNGAKMTEAGLLIQGCMTKTLVRDCTLHVEFRTPYKPAARGQGRGNSGCYVQGRYEVQVLDSFGLEGKHNECGGVYSTKAPDQNMCFPPLRWQTYDFEYTAAKFDDKGKKIKNARMTVKHNGVMIHNDIETDHSTTASPQKESPDAGPIYLQNHGNPVRYRNIWVVPKD